MARARLRPRGGRRAPGPTPARTPRAPLVGGPPAARVRPAPSTAAHRPRAGVRTHLTVRQRTPRGNTAVGRAASVATGGSTRPARTAVEGRGHEAAGGPGRAVCLPVSRSRRRPRGPSPVPADPPRASEVRTPSGAASCAARNQRRPPTTGRGPHPRDRCGDGSRLRRSSTPTHGTHLAAMLNTARTRACWGLRDPRQPAALAGLFTGGGGVLAGGVRARRWT